MIYVEYFYIVSHKALVSVKEEKLEYLWIYVPILQMCRQQKTEALSFFLELEYHILEKRLGI